MTRRALAAALLAVLAALPAAAQAERAEDPGFYLVLMWHRHQPLYPKDAAGVYSRPWVRVHATKDYLDMAALVASSPGVRAVFNLTPALLLQLEDLAAGARDRYWVATEVPSGRLAADDKRFLLERFFDVNPRVIARFPRYRELADDRARRGIDAALEAWSEQDFRDLQVLFNLAWTDPDFLAATPLAELVERGRGYVEADKEVVLAEHRRILRQVIPLHRRLWEEGRIEVTTTPLAHPILPLIADTDFALAGDPTARLPEHRYREIIDADQQVIRGLDVAERLLGRRPVGMWPAEGAVAQLVMSLFSKNGVRWVATGEDVLARSLDLSITRDGSDTVEQSELYRPWQATLRRNPPVPIFFRDVRLSDLIGFEYSGMTGGAAAADFMRRLRAIRDRLDAEGRLGGALPPVVSVILDGENAWEHYANDGKDFLRALYRRLGEADWVATITPSEYLQRFAEPEPLDEVFPASWFQPNFATWFGEEEEALAWDYLWRVRDDLRRAERSGAVEDEALAAAYERMLFAEGSDWFWWYGSDQESGDDGYFDRAFRELLGQVYDRLGRERPPFLQVPIIPSAPIPVVRQPDEPAQVTIDGDLGEWSVAARTGVAFSEPRARLRFGFDQENLYVAIDGPAAGEALDLYLQGSGTAVGLTLAGRVLGFRATHVGRSDGEGAACLAALAVPETCEPLPAARSEQGVELRIPFAMLGAMEPGDLVRMVAELPGSGTALGGGAVRALQVPDISAMTVLIDVEDPTGDDHGPGGYTYPLDEVFVAGSYDLTRFQVGTDDEHLIFAFEVRAPIANPWNSPRGLSVQTFDVYVDTGPDGEGGARLLLPGRNAALPLGHGWEYALTVEGWDSAFYVADAAGALEERQPSFDLVVFPAKGRVVVRLPRELFPGGDPAEWGYAAALMSQEGFPSASVRRIRDIERSAERWRLGGGSGAVNQPRILDVAWPEGGVQEEMLSDYPPATGSIDGLTADDFGRIPLLRADWR